jgi:replicative superfamily II helicase
MPPVIKVGDQNDLIPTKEFPYAKFPFEKFNPVQSRIFDFYDKETSAVIAAATSAGKAQPDDALVLTQHGYRRIDSLVVGDEVIGGDGKPTKVVGVYPQGKKAIFRVNFSDRTSTECCNEHLWAVRNRSDRSRNNGWKVLPLHVIKQFPKDTLHVPTVGSIEFPRRAVGLSPYVMGMLLGDGGIAYGTKVTICDEMLLRKFDAALPSGNRLTLQQNCDYLIVGDGEWNQVAYELSQLGLLGLRSYEKFVPWIYKYASIDQRMELIRGLMDSDGGSNSGKSPTFEVTSKALAEDMAFLIRSLGGWTKIRVKTRPTFRYKGEKRYGRPVYRLTVGTDFNPFSPLTDKASKYEAKERHPLRKIISVEPVGDKPCRCIKVANEDGLYITNDLIVTHNTVCAEMFLSHEIRKRGGKGMYLAPLRALAQEKIDDWKDANHHFADLNLSICTGDYRLTAKRKAELEASNLVIMTSEMLNSRCRNFKSEKNAWIKDVGTLVVDESHLLTVPGRGDHLESGLMKFTELNPNARLVLLSATMPNVDEISDWVSYVLTQRDTCLLTSSYRPCPLNLHYEKYWDGEQTYEDNELQKISMALQIVEYYPEDKFLIFAHTKRTGELMKQALQRAKINCEYHNADLEKSKRNKLEKQFKEDPSLRVIVATSTLAWGLNLPARRVIVLGVHRGLQEVATYDIFQMIGRAGRPAFDPIGDAYVLLPERTYDTQRERLRKPQRIQSQMLDEIAGRHKVLAFHLVSEIHQGNITDKDDVHHWYKRSLACFQAHEFDDAVVDGVMELLKKCGAVWEEEGKYTVTSIGKIASLFYYSPFDVSDLKRNFNLLFDNHKEDDDYWLSVALGNVDTQRGGIVSRIEREEMSRYSTQVDLMFGKGTIYEPAIKAGFAYYLLLTGKTNNHFAGFARGLQFDFPRLNQVLIALDGFTGKWGRKEWFNRLQLRINYGVKGDMVYLCQIPQVGKVRAQKLWAAGFRKVEDVANNHSKVRSVLGLKGEIMEEIIQGAKALLLMSS